LRLPRDLSGHDLAQALRRYGYELTRQTGSHLRLKSTLRGTDHFITIPAHQTLKLVNAQRDHLRCGSISRSGSLTTPARTIREISPSTRCQHVKSALTPVAACLLNPSYRRPTARKWRARAYRLDAGTRRVGHGDAPGGSETFADRPENATR